MLGSLSYYLGIEVKRDTHRMHLNQTKYMNQLIKKIGMQNCKESSTGMNISDKFVKDIGFEFSDKTLY